MSSRNLRSALISVYNKQGLDPIIEELVRLKLKLISTGGTRNYLETHDAVVTAVEDLTGFPSILGGRVKTLHPKVFGGILARREREDDTAELEEHRIETIDLVVVDLYPFAETVAKDLSEPETTEMIDIGGVALIRAAAKNFKDTVVISSRNQYPELLQILNKDGVTTLAERRALAQEAFRTSAAYDAAITAWLASDVTVSVAGGEATTLRYGENPHQHGRFHGRLADIMEQLHGKQLSYNNLVDIDSALRVVRDFEEPTVAVIKHTNTCGLATRAHLKDAWDAALAGDPVSAFGGIVVANREVDIETANAINEIFIEVIIAPSYSEPALAVLQSKKKRIILQLKSDELPGILHRTALNGLLEMDSDESVQGQDDLTVVTKKAPSANELNDLVFANKAVKHLKSNAIALVRDAQLIGIGTGQTSRVDALRQAIDKAGRFGFQLKGAVMASDAFFPFPDCVEIAHEAGITAVVQPGGSIRDQDSIDYCDKVGCAMVTTGIRHFKH